MKSEPNVIATDAIARLEAACLSIVQGKLAARELAEWLTGVQLAETDFRLMWALFESVARPSSRILPADQAELAVALAVSPAQVSAVVERLRSRNLLAGSPDPNDRRRQLCRLTEKGAAVIHAVLSVVHARTSARDDAGKEAA